MKNHSSRRNASALPMLGLTFALLATAATAAEQGAESDWKQAEAPPQLVAVPESAAAASQSAVVPPVAAQAPQGAAATPPAPPTPAVSAPAPVAAAAADARAVTEVQAASPVAPGGQPAVPLATQETAASAVPEEEQAPEPELAPLQVGDATRNLMAWQSSGVIASPIARPIAGDVAQRSYARYLKSFEFAIPEHFTSTVKSGSGGGSSGQ